MGVKPGPSLTVKEKHRLSVIKNRVLRKLLRPERNKVTGDRRRIHEEIHDLYSSPVLFGCQVRKIKMGWACGTY